MNISLLGPNKVRGMMINFGIKRNTVFTRFLLCSIGVENLLDRIERMGQTNPLWVDVTWNAGGSTSDITLELCSHI